MRFKDVVDDIRTGDLACFRGSSHWLSRLIRWRTGHAYSHVGVFLWVQANCTKRLCLIEATFGGVRLVPADRELERHWRSGGMVDWFEVVDSVNRDAVAAHCLKQWHQYPYAVAQLFYSFGTGIWQWCRRRLGKPDDVSPGYFCSELVAEAFQSGGYIPPEGDESRPHFTNPGEVAMFTCCRRVGPLLP